MNSSEELAYWYLRLNGFFPLTNFVVHAIPRRGIAQTLTCWPSGFRTSLRKLAGSRVT
jgi:hypothetical protein